MTEKRFTIRLQDDYFGITDNNVGMNVINGILTEIEAKWLCDLLNELAEENKELKEENQKLLSLIQKGVDSWNGEKKDEHLAWKRVDVE